MLKIYDYSGNFVMHLSAYKDLCIESTLSTGDETLSFTCLDKKPDIQNEYYVETDRARYVVKEIGVSTDDYPEVICQLDLEDLEENMLESFTASNASLTDAATAALTGTGWTVSTDILKKRSVATLKATPLTVLGKIADAWMCEVNYDTLNKVVTFQVQLGEDKGVYFMRSLNLRKLQLTNDSYDYYTRIIPIGADDLRIASPGYVENYDYSKKIKTLIWEDTSYTDADTLKEDAKAKLEDLAKPKRSYSADVIDLARQSSDYDLLSFGLGDTISLIDEETGIKDDQRIVKIKHYPQTPEKDTCELSNTTLTWEELQSKLDAAANAIDQVTNSDGTVNGVYVHGVKADGVVGIEVVINNSSSVKSLNNSVTKITTDIDSINGEIADLTETINDASGLYQTKKLQPDGSTIYYLHDHKTLTASTNVIQITADAIGFSTDGGETYAFGMTIDGDFIANILSAKGVDADWIKTGSITVKDSSGNTIMSVDAETGNLYATKGTIGGWKLTDTRLASSDTIYIGAKEAGLMLINESDRPFIHVQDANSNTLFKIEREGKMYAADAEIHDSSVEYAMTNYKAMMRQTGTSPTELCIVVSKDDFETKTYLQLVDKDGNRYWINTGDDAKLKTVTTTGAVTVGGKLTASGDATVSGALTASGGLTASGNPSLSWDIVKGSTTATLRRSGSSANGYGLAIAVGSTVNDLIDSTGKRTWYKSGDAISAASLTVSGSSTFSTNPLIKTLHGGTSYPAIASATSTTAQVSYIASHVNSSSVAYLGVYGKWDGSSWASKNIVSSASDIRLKENVEDSEVDALAVIKAIKMRQFDWKGNGYHQKVGFIADELEEVDPRLAFGGGYTEDGGMDTKTVDTFYLLAYTVKAIQEQQEIITAQAEKIASLEERLAKIEAMLGGET